MECILISFKHRGAVLLNLPQEWFYTEEKVVTYMI
jgi:hypothetical protein